MTKSWQLALPLAASWYNLYTLIAADSHSTDPTFTTAGFIPSKVAQLDIYATTQGVNISLDSNNEIGFPVANATEKTYGPFNANIVDLKSIFVKPSANTGVINV